MAEIGPEFCLNSRSWYDWGLDDMLQRQTEELEVLYLEDFSVHAGELFMRYFCLKLLSIGV